MKNTDRTLLEQMCISELEVSVRKKLFSFTAEDAETLFEARSLVEPHLDRLVEDFYALQTSHSEIELLIGDADTLSRLRTAQRCYINDLFSGIYDLEYVNNRLRIGLVHKRIGVEPKLYLSAVQTLQELLQRMLHQAIPDIEKREAVENALRKLMSFDVSLVFDTYIRSLVSEIEASKEKSERYALDLEAKVAQRTRQLEQMSRTDPLTGLLNRRHLNESLTVVLRAAERRNEPVTLAYIDLNEFKQINDTQGHQRGDQVLCHVSRAIASVTRAEDKAFRCGGDEFCVILPNCSESDAREMFAERLREELKRLEPAVKFSLGFAQAGPESYQEPEALMHEADERMYVVKRAGKLKAV